MGLAVALASSPTGLWPGASAPMVLTETSAVQHTEHDLYLLHHFTQVTAPAFGSPEHTIVYSIQALSLAKEYPFLMHAMIALAACHLQHLDIDARRFRKAEAFHCQYASYGLRNSVTSIKGVKDSDSILTTAMLLNTLTFCVADYRDDEIGGRCEPQWDWLRIQIGLTDLLSRTSPFHPDSIWMFTFSATKTFQFTEPPSNDLDKRLANFCGVDETSTSENNIYFDLVERLSNVVVREPSFQYLLLYLNAVGAISHQIISLLEAKDTKALLLFAHWLALMCSVDQWWCVRRTRRECWNICEILSKSLDPKQLDLLLRPAAACGFSLIFQTEEPVGDNVPALPLRDGPTMAQLL